LPRYLKPKVGAYGTPAFKRYKRPSFELKLHRNAWPAGAPSRTPLEELTALPDPLARLRALLLKGRKGRGGKVGEAREGKGRGRRGGEGGKRREVVPHFLGESYASAQCVPKNVHFIAQNTGT